MENETKQEVWDSSSIPASSWVKFDKVGDSVKGTFMSRFFKEGQGGFPSQEVFEIDNVSINDVPQEGVWYLPIKTSNKFLLARFSRLEKGRRIGVKFVALIPSKVKGHQDAKSLEPHVWDMDPAYKVAEEFDSSIQAPPSFN